MSSRPLALGLGWTNSIYQEPTYGNSHRVPTLSPTAVPLSLAFTNDVMAVGAGLGCHLETSVRRVGFSERWFGVASVDTNFAFARAAVCVRSECLHDLLSSLN